VASEKVDLLPCPLEPGAQGGGQGSPIALVRLLNLGLHIAVQHELHAMSR
jgi:hypothetical protein